MFGADVVSVVKDMGSLPIRTAFRCPWQNGVAERWVGSCRRDLLVHVIILNERHLKRLLSCYLLTTTRTGLISDSRGTRQRDGLWQFALRLKTRFNSFRDSVACTIVMRWQLRLKSDFSEDQTLFLEPGRGTVHVFCEHLSPGDDSACNPRPTSLRQAETNPLDAGRNDLANHSSPLS